ncbi:MAG: Rrf2 family transcriptional regulator [Defluviitaleaceae bacterium]|nr:Rrf2 family transcriptional regulator [Defluviitaleaceae bacterium]
MKISTKGRYGLKAMIDIAVADNCISLKTIANRQGISENYLEQLVSVLKKAGFVKSIRGAQGGYTLNMPADEITVGDILRTMEGSISPAACVDDSLQYDCSDDLCVNCVTKPVWEKINNSVNDVVNNITLYELTQGVEKIE